MPQSLQSSHIFPTIFSILFHPPNPVEPLTPHIRKLARQVPPSRVEPLSLSLDLSGLSLAAFLLSTRNGSSTRMEPNAPGRPPEFTGDFYDFNQAKARGAIAATEGRTELPVPVERFELRRLRFQHPS